MSYLLRKKITKSYYSANKFVILFNSCRSVALRKLFCWETGLSTNFVRRSTVLRLTFQKKKSWRLLIAGSNLKHLDWNIWQNINLFLFNISLHFRLFFTGLFGFFKFFFKSYFYCLIHQSDDKNDSLDISKFQLILHALDGIS